MAGSITLTTDGGTATPLSLSIDAGALTLAGQTVTASIAGGAEYYGLTPSIYAAPADVGSGNGSSEANAMDLVTALVNATAGAIIGCIPGTYTQERTISDQKFTGTWKPTNAGSSGSPITIVAKYQASTLDASGSIGTNENRSEITQTGPTSWDDAAGAGTGGPILSCTDYTHWIGFYIDQSTTFPHRDTGAAVCVNVGAGYRNCVIDGATAPYSDNFVGIRFEDSTDCFAINNVIRDFVITPAGRNACGIETYNTRGLTVEHNTISGCGTGIYMKGDQGGQSSYGFTTNYNRVESCIAGIACGQTDAAGADNEVAYNLILSCGDGGSLRLVADANPAANWKVHHNTAITQTGSSVCNLGNNTTISGHVVRDNLFVHAAGGSSDQLFAAQSRTEPLPDLYNNWYWVISGTQYWSYGASTYTTLGTWQAGASEDTDSSYGDPEFTDYAGGDYTLDVGSGALTASSTSGPVGCYLTGSETIGVEV